MYYKIENNVIVKGPIHLPSEIAHLSSNELLENGYYEIVVLNFPEYDSNLQYLTLNLIKNKTNVVHDWTINNISENEIPNSVVKRKNKMKEAVTNHRYFIETAGLTINNTTIKTDRESQSTIACTLNFLQLVPSAVINWKSAYGWTEINLQSANFSAIAMGTHVQACFSCEKVLHEIIDEATDHLTLDGIDILDNWPPNIITLG